MFEVFEITEEEKQMLIAHRTEEARKAEIDSLHLDIVEALTRIEQLGGRIILPAIGGKYIPYHTPVVMSKDVMCEYHCY
jgi:hypothetical protein